jgi:hypothetical protein
MEVLEMGMIHPHSITLTFEKMQESMHAISTCKPHTRVISPIRKYFAFTIFSMTYHFGEFIYVLRHTCA